MAQNKVVEDFLSQDLDRKEFLRRVGGLGLTMVGIAGFLRFFSEGGFGRSSKQVSAGYGSGPYGGPRKEGVAFHTGTVIKKVS